MNKGSSKIVRRDEQFAERIVSRIWQEEPSEDNPYLAKSSRCHGYEHIELIKKKSFAEVFYLLFRGELPSSDEAALFEALMVAFISPGPRHSATRSAMNAGVGKTDPALILPIALTTMSGSYNAAGAIEEVMRFLRKQQRRLANEVAEESIDNSERPEEGDWHPAPGFGSLYNSVDLQSKKILSYLATLNAAGKTLKWVVQFSKAIAPYGLGALPVGVVAAVLADLGFQPRAAAGIYQIISAPGLFAHGIELANKPLTAMPFIADEDYLFED